MQVERPTGVGLEALLTLAVLAFLTWQFSHLQGEAATIWRAADADPPAAVFGDGMRYQHDLWRSTLPFSPEANETKLPTYCEDYAANLEPRVARLLCPKTALTASPAALPGAAPQWPSSFDAAQAAIQNAISGGIATQQRSLAGDALSQAEGVLPEDRAADAAKLSMRVEHYRAHYRIAGSAIGAGAQPLDCAWEMLRGRHAALNGVTGQAEAREATTIVGLAAAVLDGKSSVMTAASKDGALQAGSECKALGSPAGILKQAAEVVDRARNSVANAERAETMMRWMERAPWLVSAWVTVALLLLNIGRRSELPVRFVPLALLAWGLTGWVTGVPAPEFFFLGASLTAVILLLAAIYLNPERLPIFAPTPKQVCIAPWAFPLFVLFVGIGTWMVFDLSINGYLKNRFLAHRQMTNLFIGLVALTVLAPLRPSLAGIVPRFSALLLNAMRGGASLAQRLRPWLLAGMLAIGLLVIAFALRGWRQFTSELVRVWLILGVASLFLVRNTLWGSNQLSTPSLLRSLMPLIGLAAVVFAALLLTDDMGPLLVILYSSGIFIGAMVAQSVLSRGATLAVAVIAGLGATLLAGSLTSGLLFSAAKLPFGAAARVAERIESARTPFTAFNDQMAHVAWFRASTPDGGYGFGAVPWCGTLPSAACNGLPAQTQSDYTLTALHGVFGQTGSLIFAAAYILWLAVIAFRHATATDGLLDPNRPRHTEAAWIAWLGVAWATLTIAQTLVTISGNLGWLPLTGVTWPLVSFGIWSMVINAAFLALFINRPESQS